MNKRFLNSYIKSFGDRLIYLYREYRPDLCKDNGNIDFSASAKCLFDMGLRAYKDTDISSDKSRKRKSTADLMRNHTDIKDIHPKISGEWLHIYCSLFGCSCDFLMGYIEMPTHENTSITRVTGLNNKAINVLKRDTAMLGTLADTLNAIVGNIKTADKGVTSNACCRLFDDLYTYLKAGHGSQFYFDDNPDNKKDTVWLDTGGYDIGLFASRFDGMILSELTADLVNIKNEIPI